jgi:hypothetical protein
VLDVECRNMKELRYLFLKVLQNNFHKTNMK